MINNKPAEDILTAGENVSCALLFVGAGYDLKLIKETIELAKKNRGELKVISLSANIDDALLKEGVQSRCLSLYCNDNLWEYISERSIKWILNWPNQKIINNKSIKEEFIYKNCSLWWFGADSLLSDKGGVFDVFFYIELFSLIVEKEGPSKVYFTGEKNLRLDLLKNIVNLLGINFQYIEPENRWLARFFYSRIYNLSNFPIKVFRFFSRFSEIIYRKTAFSIYIAKNLFTGKKSKHLKKVLIFPHHGKYARQYYVNGVKYIGDFYYHGIEEALRQDSNLDVVSLSPGRPILDKFSWLSDFVEIIKGDSYKTIDGYIMFSSYFKKISHKIFFENKWEEISVAPSFRKGLILENIDLFPFLQEHFKKMFVQSFSTAIGLLDVANNIISKEKPDIILTIYETSTDKRAIEVAAKEHGITVIGLQHGIIGSYHASRVGYFYKPGETWYSGEDSALKCPIPKKTLVFGDYFKDLLIKDGYPFNTVVATGCPRFDYLFDYDAETIKKKCERLGIAFGKETVLFISDGICDNFMYQEIQNNKGKNIQAARDILSISQDDVQLIIKAHPRDNEGSYNCLLKEFPGRSIKITKYGNLSALIQCASVVVMKSSTAGIEAVIHKKPVIVFNLNNGPQIASYYVAGGVALEANDRGSLKIALDQLLNQTEIREKLINNMDGFIKKFAFAADGRSSSRVKNAILQELDSSS